MFGFVPLIGHVTTTRLALVHLVDQANAAADAVRLRSFSTDPAHDNWLVKYELPHLIRQSALFSMFSAYEEAFFAVAKAVECTPHLSENGVRIKKRPRSRIVQAHDFLKAYANFDFAMDARWRAVEDLREFRNALMHGSLLIDKAEDPKVWNFLENCKHVGLYDGSAWLCEVPEPARAETPAIAAWLGPSFLRFTLEAMDAFLGDVHDRAVQWARNG